jgi:predicted CoA-substrate-specific enzyme activase
VRPTGNILGIDQGSVSVAFVEIDPRGEIVSRGYAPHGGRVAETLCALIDADVLGRIRRIAVTSTTSADVARSATFDSQVAGIAAARHLHPDARGLLLIGGEKFCLIRFDSGGEYLGARSNSSCAAGTGSFLDQQARTLGLRDGADLAEEAGNATGEPPRIASRCAVFARTDLIHAQQEGYSRAEIGKGLCAGLANIVADSLTAGGKVEEPLVFAGGVARNREVRARLEARLGTPLVVDDLPHLYGAFGAALCLLDQGGPEFRVSSIAELIRKSGARKQYDHEPLPLQLEAYPDFESERRYEFAPAAVPGAPPVEVDIYLRPPTGRPIPVTLGIDIGSTSTKAVLLDREGAVIAGLYTRTSGRPVTAMQGIFEAVHELAGDLDVEFRVLGAGTTGSGRKLVGAVIGADRILDEITAHARAAYELDPETDTIIEIGGQDAKFTTLRHGMVTSAVMNTVCAAGTGSFIEQQADRLSVPLTGYAEAVAGARAPLASDRCTVFMQRDIDHLLASGYAVNEILATVLHSVRENYLTKVAREGSIGKRICFQGATAKNRALVAAFEQRLGRPIHVSRYCHLTGALGVALLLRDELPADTAFRGFDLYRKSLPIRNEVCELCRNHCKIVSTEVNGRVAAYGFLCGRDYDQEEFVSKNTSGFDLAKTRHRVLRSRPGKEPTHDLTIGLPTGLYLFEELELWRRFFQVLGVRVVTSERLKDPVKSGKRLMQAEFCAPMAAWHGHVASLLATADYIFAPVYLEAREREHEHLRQFCYYSQYASALAHTMEIPGLDEKLLRPVLTQGFGDVRLRFQLYQCLKPVFGEGFGFAAVAMAFTEALEFHTAGRARLKEIMAEELDGHADIAVVLLGRPYACLPPGMNKGIPEILGALGVKTFFMDMLETEGADLTEIEELLDQVHWSYAARILTAAFVAARQRGLYPVLVTSFKCAPDSMILEFFRRIMDREGKPYLILELDEHGSSVGYETRIEAVVRSFRNHFREPEKQPGKGLPVRPEVIRKLEGRTVFLPNWDPLSCALLAANLRREGVDAHVLPETDRTVRRGLRTNTGQCVPLNAVAEGFITEVKRRGLDPAKTALWTIYSRIACNIGMYPAFLKALFEAHGEGFEAAGVYCGELSSIEISVRAAVNTYFAYMFGGMLRRMACRVRPYELESGAADTAVEAGLCDLTALFEGRGDRMAVLSKVVDRFAAIETTPRNRPKVAIFGDLYVRDNDVMSQDLVRFIERHGGEVITTPYSEYVKIIANAYFQRWFREGKILSLVVNGSLLLTAKALERQCLEEFGRVLGRIAPVRPTRSSRDLLAEFGLTDAHKGESLDNLLKVFHILETDPDVSLFVQANPAFCCPSLVTEAMSGRIQKLTGVPVVTLTYDGTAAPRNEAVIPYLAFPAGTREPVA